MNSYESMCILLELILYSFTTSFKVPSVAIIMPICYKFYSTIIWPRINFHRGLVTSLVSCIGLCFQFDSQNGEKLLGFDFWLFYSQIYYFELSGA